LSKLVIGERNYLIQRLNNILEFQTYGKFVTRVGTTERGPNEFTAAHDVNINNTNQEIYLLARWQKKFFVYGIDISFISEMTGTADIITDNKRLIYRFIKPLSNILSK